MSFFSVKGQAHAKRALEVAAAGGHSILLAGPSGVGKTMLLGALREALVAVEPNPFPERLVLVEDIARLTPKNLRTISRLLDPCVDPARVPPKIVLAAEMQFCPCGGRTPSGPAFPCYCSDAAVQTHMRRFHETLGGHFAILLETPPLRSDELRAPNRGEADETIRARIEAARKIQNARAGTLNGRLPAVELDAVCPVAPGDGDSAVAALFGAAKAQLNLDAREAMNVRRVARTLADLAGEEVVRISHLAEAVQYQGCRALRASA